MIALAKEMGRLDYENVMDELTPHQFSVLMAHQQLRPTGERREDWRHAHLVATMANLVRGKDDDPVTAEDALAHFQSEIQPRKKAKSVGPAAAAAMARGRR